MASLSASSLGFRTNVGGLQITVRERRVSSCTTITHTKMLIFHHGKMRDGLSALAALGEKKSKKSRTITLNTNLPSLSSLVFHAGPGEASGDLRACARS